MQSPQEAMSAGNQYMNLWRKWMAEKRTRGLALVEAKTAYKDTLNVSRKRHRAAGKGVSDSLVDAEIDCKALEKKMLKAEVYLGEAKDEIDWCREGVILSIKEMSVLQAEMEMTR